MLALFLLGKARYIMGINNKEIICTLRNRLQAPKVALKRVFHDKGTPKAFYKEALDDLEEAITILKNLTQKLST